MTQRFTFCLLLVATAVLYHGWIGPILFDQAQDFRRAIDVSFAQIIAMYVWWFVFSEKE